MDSLSRRVSTAVWIAPSCEGWDLYARKVWRGKLVRYFSGGGLYVKCKKWSSRWLVKQVYACWVRRTIMHFEC